MFSKHAARAALLVSVAIGAVAAWSGGVTPAVAQEWGDPTVAARTHAGPIGVAPTLSILNVGVDPNVFNTATNEVSDFTTTFEPSVNVWAHFGRNWVTASHRTDYVYFQNYVSQRALSTFNAVRVDVPMNRVKLFAGTQYTNARDRPGLDIDLRVRHQELRLSGGADVHVRGGTSIALTAERLITQFESGTEVLGVPLGPEMNHHSDFLTLGVQHVLTPLTSLVLNATAQQDRFPGAPDRNLTVLQVMPGLTFKPLALLAGRVNVGMLRVLPPSGAAFQGLAADVSLGYALAGSTLVSGRLARTVNYSFDPAVPYYVLTDQSLMVDHRFSDRWNVSVSAGHSLLSYQETPGLTLFIGSSNRVNTYDAGIGYRLTPRINLAVHANRMQRLVPPGSAIEGFQATRIFSTVTYGGR